MKTLFGVSAKIPPVDPQIYPLSGNGRGQFGTTSYGPVLSSPPFSCAKVGAERQLKPNSATSESRAVRMHTFLSIENVLLGRNTGGSYQIPNLSQALFGSARRVKKDRGAARKHPALCRRWQRQPEKQP